MSETSSHAHKMRSQIFWILLILLLAVLAWTSRYWSSAEFGLYEDDLTFIPGAIEASFGEILQMISNNFSTLAEQGRPFMWSFVVFFAHLGWRMGGLQAMYLIAFSIWMLNLVLFLLLLKRIRANIFFAAVAGLAYVLFTADINQAFLFNAFGLQTAITFLLVGLHFFLMKSSWRWFAYLFLALVMFTYETPFWLFLAAPLLTQATGKALRRDLWINTGIVFIVFVLIYIMRLSVGESRVASLGPAVSLGAYSLRSLQVLRQFSFQSALGVGLSAGVIFAVLFWSLRELRGVEKLKFSFQKGWWARLDPATQQILRLLLAGIIMLVFAYPLTFILRPYAVTGRETRVHMAAVLGAAIVIASVLTLLVVALRQKGMRVGLLVLISVVFGLNFVYGFSIQAGYRRAWDLQRRFWTQLIPLVGDARDGTAILIQPEGLEDVHHIDANTWNLPKLLPQLFVFPEKWEEAPRVFRLIDGWQENIIRVPGYFTLDGSNTYADMIVFGDFLQKNTIIISGATGMLERQLETKVMGEAIALKPIGKEILPTLETRPLYDLLIEAE